MPDMYIIEHIKYWPMSDSENSGKINSKSFPTSFVVKVPFEVRQL